MHSRTGYRSGFGVWLVGFRLAWLLDLAFWTGRSPFFTSTNTRSWTLITHTHPHGLGKGTSSWSVLVLIGLCFQLGTTRRLQNQSECLERLGHMILKKEYTLRRGTRRCVGGGDLWASVHLANFFCGVCRCDRMDNLCTYLLLLTQLPSVLSGGSVGECMRLGFGGVWAYLR